MQVLLVVALLGLARLLVPVAAPADGTAVYIQHPPRFVVVDDYIRDFIAADWDAHEHDAIPLERAYCLRWQLDEFAGEFAYRVTQISLPDSIHATPSSISFSCPKGPNTATAHAHPSTTCVSDTECIRGGSYARQCFASDQDYRFLTYTGEPFGLVVCDRFALVPFYRR
jgi:hypothetical protein